ncbi:MBL fold metallo-hydrolase [Roseivivax sediminis]|uniref:Tat (Twin-arginine translocation) pathway signal sequence n=1 Tax=Roseivivax sediminis TaxID=936889 RepID=A0A1I1UJK1_9RHOB|nr:MBL fold metallo-hydrolase [Roseivivax sediminis]SFD69808.1 Tat (twin-arginine translocation) pathway signal sequence [Roseivivax sediminis]
MSVTRRRFMATTGAACGAAIMLPFQAMAEQHMSNTFSTDGGEITVHPVSHASFVMETPMGVIHVDPVGGADAYADLPAPDLILITHEHGDHYDAETLQALMGEGTHLITNPAVAEMLPEALAERAEAIGNGESTDWDGLGIEAIPAYNTTEGRLDFHPGGRDNGYVLSFEGFRVYISGDTEDIPEMRALENIDVAFVCMNLPFTMDAEAAASAVNAFAPAHVYPYHFRGRDGGTQDPAAFAEMVESAEVLTPDWYPDNESL